MTLNEIAYNIRNIVEGGISGEDSNISIRQIEAMVHYHRAELLMKYTDNGRYISEKMISEDTVNLENNSISLPETVGFPNNRGIVSIVWYDNDDSFQLGEEGVRKDISLGVDSDKEFLSNSRFTGNSIRAYIRDGNLFFFENGDAFVGGGFVKIRYVASKPSDVAAGYYPIPDELISTLTRRVLETEFRMMLAVGNDMSNNSMDDNMGKTSLTSKKQKASPSSTANTRKSRTR